MRRKCLLGKGRQDKYSEPEEEMKHMYSYSFFSGQKKAQIHHHVTSTVLHSSVCVCAHAHACTCMCMRAVEDTARRDMMLSEETHSLSGNRHGLDYNKSFSVCGLGSED